TISRLRSRHSSRLRIQRKISQAAQIIKTNSNSPAHPLKNPLPLPAGNTKTRIPEIHHSPATRTVKRASALRGNTPKCTKRSFTFRIREFISELNPFHHGDTEKSFQA